MATRQVDGRPATGRDWLTTEGAARLWNDIVGSDCETINRPVSGQLMRKLCRTATLERLGIAVAAMPGRYYISRRSLLAFMASCLERATARCSAELARDEESARPT